MRTLCIIFGMILLTGCGTDDPKPPEAFVSPLETVHYSPEAIEVSKALNENNMTVRHHVKEKDVYVEVVIPGFNFSEMNKKEKVSGEGYIQLYLNGKKIDEIHQAAFIVKGLPSGKHSLKIEIVQNDSTPYGVEKEFTVTIP